MAESRAKRMQLVLSLTERQEKEAATRVEECKTLLTQEQEQLQQLQDYSGQYLETYADKSGLLQVQQRINYSSFIQRLTVAIEEQRYKVERTAKVHEQALARWQDVYLRRKSISQLIERLQQEENALLDKRLQKELDELAAQQFNRREL